MRRWLYVGLMMLVAAELTGCGGKEGDESKSKVASHGQARWLSFPVEIYVDNRIAGNPAIEADVLADAEVPDEGTVCDPDPEVERPEWWDDIPVPEGIDDLFMAPELQAALGLAPTQIYAEMRTSSLSPEEVLDAYREPLEDAGFSFILDQEPVPGFHSGHFSPCATR